MRSIEDELERTGADYRLAAAALRDHRWDDTSARKGPRRQLLAAMVGIGVVLLGAAAILAGRQGSTDLATSSGPDETAVTGQTSEASPSPQAEFEDPPHLLLDADGWEMVYYSENTYQPFQQEGALVFRLGGGGMGGPTFVAEPFEVTETHGWSAGDGAERIELEGRRVSVIDESVVPMGHVAGVEFDDGSLVVAQGFGMDRATFVEAASQITLSPLGDPVVVPPAGYEQIDLSAPYAETVTQREASYEGPGGGAVEVRIWSGSMGDVELQAMNRALEAEAVRATTIDRASAIIAYHSNDLSRIFVVGGDDGYVIELDFNPLGSRPTDEQLDAILAQLRRVDLATFEAALPEGSITSATAGSVIAEMLADMPLPEGFDSSVLTSKGDRYQTGAHVAGAVACAWLDQWVDATDRGETGQATAAAEALATSRSWSILLEMQDQGGYSQVVWEYADAIASNGTIIGGKTLTVEESYQAALGCVSE